MSNYVNMFCPKCNAKNDGQSQFCRTCAFDLSEANFSTAMPFVPTLQSAQPISDEPPNVTYQVSGNERNNFARTETAAETSKIVLSEMSPTEAYVANFGISREVKIIIGIGLGVIVLLFGSIVFSSSDSKPDSSNPSYNTNTSYYNSTSSYGSTNSMSSSSMLNRTEQSDATINSSSTHTNSSLVSLSSKKGHLVTDSNIRDAPSKDAYSVGIHYKDAKVEILDETSYETEGKVSTWYKVRVTEYGCSKDSSLGCGKNSDSDSDEGWVNAKIVLITDGSNSTAGEQRTFQQPRKIENYSVRIYNVDDTATVYVNGSEVLTVPYSRVENSDITGSLRPGNNEVRFVLVNSIKEFTYGFEIYKDNKSIFKDECGVIGKFGCKGSLQTGLVYDRTVTVKVNTR